MKTSVQPNRRIALGDQTETELYWNEQCRRECRKPVRLNYRKVTPRHPRRSSRSLIHVYAIALTSEDKRIGAWGCIIKWPKRVELLHGVIPLAPDINLSVIAAVHTLRCTKPKANIIFCSEFTEIMSVLKNGEQSAASQHEWGFLRHLVKTRNVTWQLSKPNEHPLLKRCGLFVASDLKVSGEAK